MLEFERINNVLLTGMSEVGDVLLIRQTLSNIIQVEIRVNGYLLDLITIRPQKLKIYPLVGIKKNALILVQEVSVGLDMTLENNRTFRNFNFFRRLKESSLWLEDKSSKEKFTLFNDDNYKDYDFYKQYPTIFHLRNELIKNPEKKDIRLVYLAIHSIFKSRGHFLFEGQNLKEIKNFETLYNNLIAFLEDNGINKIIDKNNIEKLEKIVCDSKKGLKDKEKEFKEIFNSDKQLVAIFKLSVGSSVSLNDLNNCKNNNKKLERKRKCQN